MSYVWGAHGLAFEYPTPYRTENRFLIIRAGVLTLCALALFWLTATDPPTPPVTLALKKIERGSTWPHVLAACVMLLLAVIDIVRAARQRRLLLGEGHPAPLAPELSPQGAGISPGGDWLLGAIKQRAFPAVELGGRYRALLRSLAPRLAHAPAGLQVYLRKRLAQLMGTAGLAAVLGATWLLAPNASGLPVAGVWVAALFAALVGYCAWLADDAPGPATIIGLWVVAAAGAGVLIWIGPKIPQVALLARGSLPTAAAALLACAAVIDLLAFLAGRAQTVAAPLVGKPSEATAELESLPLRLANEIDKELMRRWADGVPNRRFVRRLPAGDVDEGAWMVMEETQPVLPQGATTGLRTLPAHSAGWLLVLSLLGLLLTGAGCLLWLQTAQALLAAAESPWPGIAMAIGLVSAGGWAVRVGHFPAGRMEVASTLHVVDFATLGETGQQLRARLRVSVWSVVSATYAAASSRIGSRCVLSMAESPSSAAKFIEQIEYFLGRSPGARVDTGTGPKTAPAASAAAGTTSTSRDQVRFCVVCGAARLQSARFCQNCGNAYETVPL